jgi:hypothetical protein
MAKLELTEQERLDLMASLEALLGCMKSLHATVGAVMADVSAIRNTIFDDPEDLAVYRSNVRTAAMAAKPAVEKALSSYDDLLEIMNTGYAN